MSTITVNLTVNGKPVSEEVEPRLLLIHMLREKLNITGPHIDCWHGTGRCPLPDTAMHTKS